MATSARTKIKCLMNVTKYEINVWQLRKEREQVTGPSEKHDIFVKTGKKAQITNVVSVFRVLKVL